MRSREWRPGCPCSATEDLVYLLEGQGVPTGVDLDALLSVSAWMTDVLDRPVPGQLLRAGGLGTPTRS